MSLYPHWCSRPSHNNNWLGFLPLLAEMQCCAHALPIPQATSNCKRLPPIAHLGLCQKIENPKKSRSFQPTPPGVNCAAHFIWQPRAACRATMPSLSTSQAPSAPPKRSLNADRPRLMGAALLLHYYFIILLLAGGREPQTI